MDEPWVYRNSQNSPWPRLGKMHHLFFYNIICDWLWGLYPNVILSRDSQVGNPKNLEIGTPKTLEGLGLLFIPPIEMKFEEKL
jgi:hypothetical protein